MTNLLGKLRNFNIPFLSSLQLYFDIGTSVTRIAIKNKGVVLREPTYLGFNTKLKEPIFFGAEAKSIIGKTPEFIKISRPLVSGIISDFDAEVYLMKYFLEKSVEPYLHQNRLIKPTMKALVSYPVIATEIEQKAIEEILLKAGCNDVTIIEKPIATAIGCGIDIFSHHPHLIVDLGGGLVEISIVSGGGIVSCKTLKSAGEHMDKTIANYVYLKHGLILGEATAEKLKTATLNFTGEEVITLVRGKSLETGLPKSIKMRTGEIKEALLSNFGQIVETTKELIEVSPPEVVDEIFGSGVVLTGGLAGVKGIEKFFTDELKINVYRAANHLDTGINGLISLDKHPGFIRTLPQYR